jgi:Flp pilus assembly protein TadG
MRCQDRSNGVRSAAAALEFVLVMPLVILLFVFAMDFCRIFYYQTTLTNCARSGAIYESDPSTQSSSPYGSTTAAAQADWPSSMGTAPTPTVTYTTSQGATYATVTMTYTFNTLLSYTGIPATVNLTANVQVRVAQRYPNF